MPQLFKMPTFREITGDLSSSSSSSSSSKSVSRGNGRLVGWYLEMLNSHPVLTRSVTAGQVTRIRQEVYDFKVRRMSSSHPRCFSAGATTDTSVDLLPPPPPSHLFPEIDQPRPSLPPPQPTVPLSYYFPEIEYQHPPTPPTASETQDSDEEEEVHPSPSPSSSSAASEIPTEKTVGVGPPLMNQTCEGSSHCMRLVKIYCEGDPLLHVSIRKDRLILAPADPLDPNQWWLKDEKHARIKDEEGFPCFALVSRVTRQVIGCLTPRYEEPLQLIEYNPDVVDDYVLWTEGRDLGSGYRPVRPVSNIQLYMNAYGGVSMGTHLQLHPWAGGLNNEIWRITTIKKFLART